MQLGLTNFNAAYCYDDDKNNWWYGKNQGSWEQSHIINIFMSDEKVGSG